MEKVKKKIVGFLKERSLRKFIFLSIISAMLFLLFGMSISRMIVYSKVKLNTIEANEKYAAVLFKRIDTEMNVVNSIINNYINNAVLNEISRCNEADYKFIELVVDASADISRTVAENLFVDDIVVVFDDKNIAFSKDGRFSKEYFEKSNYYYEEIAKMTGQNNIIRTVPYFEKKSANENYKVLLFSVPADGYTVNVMVDYGRIEQIFGQNIAEGKKLVILSETDVIYNNTSYTGEQLFASIGFGENYSDIKSDTFAIKGEEFFDAYTNLQSIGWTCHLFLPEKILSGEINMVMNAFVYSYIVVLLAMIFLVTAYRKKILFPLKSLLDDMEKNAENKDNQSEFERINRYISDMNSRNKKYTEFIENSTKQMQAVLYKQILENQGNIDEEMQKMYFGSMEHEKFLLIKIFIVSGDFKFIKEYAEDFLTHEECYFTVFACSENSLYAVVNCTDENVIIKKAAYGMEKLRLMGNDVFAVTAEAVDSVTKLSLSSLHIEQIFNNRNASYEKAFYTSSDMTEHNGDSLFDNAGDELKKCILEKGKEETEKCFLSYSDNKNKVSYRIYKKFLVEVISAIETATAENGIDMNGTGYDIVMLNNSKCEFVNITKEEAKLFALSGIVAERISQMNTGEDRIIDYIKENYSNYISLDIVAQKFNMNPNYLSGYIKRKIGMNYQDFVNNLRIEHAKKLISETDMTISEIAAVLGYDNSSSFIRFFKKHEKESPGAFRSKNKE